MFEHWADNEEQRVISASPETLPSNLDGVGQAIPKNLEYLVADIAYAAQRSHESQNVSPLERNARGDAISPFSPQISSPPLNTRPTQIHLSTQMLDFGVLQLQQTKDLAFTITNQGPQKVTVHVSIDSPHWTVSHNAFVLESGKSTTVTLRFSPTLNGAYLANVRVSNNEEIQDIFLSGAAWHSAESQRVKSGGPTSKN